MAERCDDCARGEEVVLARFSFTNHRHDHGLGYHSILIMMIFIIIFMRIFIIMMMFFREELRQVAELLGDEKRDGTCRVMTIGGS